MSRLITLFSAFALTACSAAQAPSNSAVTSTKAKRAAMVATANPHATSVGAEILRAGGSAVDAAVAIEAVLSLVEPQSSGLGGGAYMVHFDNESKEVVVYDGRETAPMKSTADMFLKDDGDSYGFLDAKNSGLSTGVPGVVSMLALAHADHGELEWATLFERATQLATDGFALSPRLQNFLVRFGKYIPDRVDEGPLDAHNYFFDDQGEPLAVGAIRTNPDYARALAQIALDPANFYTGELAKQIVEQTSKSPREGSLSLQDLADYKAQKRPALCSPYKDKTLCGPPPSSSWLAVGAIAGLLAHAPSFSAEGAQDPKNWATFAEAQRLAYADRDQYVADDQFAEVPVTGLLDQDYLKSRAKLIGGNAALKTVKPGDPWAYEPKEKVAYGKDATNDMAGTTHFVVVDGDGNVVSMTASVESIFGSTRMAGGMFLNNQLTDFSFKPNDENGKPMANRVEPGKRPRSSMSPTIVLDQDGEFLMATGSPGGNSIIAYTAKTLVGVLDWNLSPQQAIELPNLVARNDKVRIEKERATPELITGLREFGFEVKESAGENSGFSVVLRNADGSLEGGVDPRREGVIEIVTF